MVLLLVVTIVDEVVIVLRMPCRAMDIDNRKIREVLVVARVQAVIQTHMVRDEMDIVVMVLDINIYAGVVRIPYRIDVVRVLGLTFSVDIGIQGIRIEGFLVHLGVLGILDLETANPLETLV